MPPSDEQRLVIYTAHKEEVYRPVIEEFEDQTGIWVDVQAGGTTQMLRRIRQEQSAVTSSKTSRSAVTSGKTSPADIMFGGGAENLEAYRDCFAPYHSPLEGSISSSFRSPDGTWTPFTELPIVFIYNSKLVAQQNAPRSWKDFLDGKWSGQISFADPQKSGTSITILETLKLVNDTQGWGMREEEVLSQFAEQLGGHLAAGSGDVPGEVASGTRMVGITLEETALKFMAGGSDIGMIYPEEGTSAVPDCVAIVRSAPHEANAKRFVDFVIDRPVQKYTETNLFRRSIRTDVHETIRGTNGLSEQDTGTLHILPFDVPGASEDGHDMLEKFLSYMRQENA
ncbi:MAG: extracellular solute-binding protein [Firmicutes bacterium]|nr:extracellular solute-binding protein [Bacillota bacterium]